MVGDDSFKLVKVANGPRVSKSPDEINNDDPAFNSNATSTLREIDRLIAASCIRRCQGARQFLFIDQTAPAVDERFQSDSDQGLCSEDLRTLRARA